MIYMKKWMNLKVIWTKQIMKSITKERQLKPLIKSQIDYLVKTQDFLIRVMPRQIKFKSRQR
jgi:hypothetical protein